ncbi:HNH endonuclease [Enterococcus avium]|nr:HNH endonuclease signature motif containing protein [Enterococcus avium]MDT2396282.1 HNH endonuclease signature motif containing protein [Enterococcus avium]MDT2442573.1 HNH endonuclease signature motif containing protein [Enterococcus avium]MDT2455495.1 HNH endonuclease signature motif containing protein [Enterococcus avium]
MDHVIPISKGGTHSWDNVRLAHRHCNAIKRDALLKYLKTVEK